MSSATASTRRYGVGTVVDDDGGEEEEDGDGDWEDRGCGPHDDGIGQPALEIGRAHV